MTNKEFNEKCLKDRTVQKPAAVKIVGSDRDRDFLFKRALDNSDYFLKGTKVIAKSDAPYLAFILGFFAMEHRAYAVALLYNSYQIEDHICAQIYFSRVLGRKDLSKLLSDAWNARIGYNYRMDLSIEGDIKDVENFMEKILKLFIAEIDKLIAEKS